MRPFEILEKFEYLTYKRDLPTTLDGVQNVLLCLNQKNMFMILIMCHPYNLNNDLFVKNSLFILWL